VSKGLVVTSERGGKDLSGLDRPDARDADAPAASPPEPHLSPAAEAVANSLSTRSISRVIVSGSVRVAEAVLVAASGYLIVLAMVEPEHRMPLAYAVATIGAGLLYVLFAQVGGTYRIVALRRLTLPLGRILVNWLVVFAVLAMIAFLTRTGDDFSRGWFLVWFVLGLVAIVAFRAIVAARLRAWSRAGLLERRAVIVGGGAPAEKLILALAAEPDQDIRICGIFDDRKNDRSPPIVAGYPKLGTIPELVTFARKARIDLLIVTIPITAEKRVIEMLQQLWVLPVDIRLSMQTASLRFRPHTYSYVGTVPFLDIADKPIADWNYVAKWLLDRILGGLMLLFALPVMAIIAIAIKLDSRGPVLFRQRRYGFNNEVIEVYKFRSMYTEQTDEKAARQVTRDDPRVTRVGRLIRKTSLDELPQLFNVVFQGTLSLVGPRPHAVEGRMATSQLFEQVVDGYFARHRVKPGITGWAQVNGLRGETDTEAKIQARVEYDFYYIENWSVLFDLYILMITPLALVKGVNAY
jgi:Undecaprenyl-phosphate glucose phosphotransferase